MKIKKHLVKLLKSTFRIERLNFVMELISIALAGSAFHTLITDDWCSEKGPRKIGPRKNVHNWKKRPRK